MLYIIRVHIGIANMVSGCFPTKDMHTLSLLRSSHLDIKDAQCAKKNDGRKILYHSISRVGTAGVQKRHFGRSNIQLSSKVAKFAG